MAKAYNLPFDYVLYDVSYTNLVLYGSVLPSYEIDKDKDKRNGKEEFIEANRENNERIKEIFKRF